MPQTRWPTVACSTKAGRCLPDCALESAEERCLSLCTEGTVKEGYAAAGDIDRRGSSIARHRRRRGCRPCRVGQTRLRHCTRSRPVRVPIVGGGVGGIAAAVLTCRCCWSPRSAPGTPPPQPRSVCWSCCRPLCSSGWLGGCWPGGPTRRPAWAGCEGWIGGEGQRGVGRAGRGRQALRRHRRRRRRRHLLTPGGRLIHRVARPVGLRQGTTWQCWPVCSRPTGAISSSTAPRCSPSRPRGAPVSLVFQNPLLFPHLNVAQNVGFGLRMHGVSRRDIAPRVQAMLERVQLGARRVGELSGGQEQRVALARAFGAGPEAAAAARGAVLPARPRTPRRNARTDLHPAQRGNHDHAVPHPRQGRGRRGRRPIVPLLDGRLAGHGSPELFYRTPPTLTAARFFGAPTRSPTVSRMAGPC